MSQDSKILSIMTDLLGHRTYGELMRKYFQASSPSESIDFYWFTDDREFITRLLVRPLHTFFPHPWIQKQNLDFHRLRAELALAYIARRLLSRKIKLRKYSVIYLHTQVMALLSLDLIKFIPTVVGLDFTAVLASQENTDPQFRWTYKPNILLEKQVYETAKFIVSWSEITRKSVINDYGIDPKKVVTISPGVNVEIFNSFRKTLKKEEGICKILFVGGDFQRKGGNDLLEVFLAEFSELAELYLITKNPIKCEHPNVHVYNDIRSYTPEWLNLFCQADIFVMPTYAEALGLVFMEAMAANLPVIATDLPQITEMVVDQETGFLIKPGDRYALANRIRVLLENPLLRWKMGEKAQKIVNQKFNAYTNFQRLESIFQDLSESRSKR